MFNTFFSVAPTDRADLRLDIFVKKRGFFSDMKTFVGRFSVG